MIPQSLRATLVACSTILLLTASARAEVVEFGWYGVVGEVTPAFAAALPPGSNIGVGHPAFVRYEFETTTPDQDLTTTGGNYVGALTSFSIQIGTFSFTKRVAAPSNAIVILADTYFRFYEAVASVDASSPIAAYPDLRGDVLLEPKLPTQIPSDALLLTVPDPDAWATAASGVLDPTGNVLLDVDLLAVCVGTCQTVPEPGPGLALACGLVSLAGWTRRRRRRGCAE